CRRGAGQRRLGLDPAADRARPGRAIRQLPVAKRRHPTEAAAVGPAPVRRQDHDQAAARRDGPGVRQGDSVTVRLDRPAERVEERGRPAGRRRGGSRGGTSYLFVVPAMAFYALVVLYPTVAGAWYALTDWTGRNVAPNFVGLANFAELFSSPPARTALWNTLVIAAATTVIQTV